MNEWMTHNVIYLLLNPIWKSLQIQMNVERRSPNTFSNLRRKFIQTASSPIAAPLIIIIIQQWIYFAACVRACMTTIMIIVITITTFGIQIILDQYYNIRLLGIHIHFNNDNANNKTLLWITETRDQMNRLHIMIALCILLYCIYTRNIWDMRLTAAALSAFCAAARSNLNYYSHSMFF